MHAGTFGRVENGRKKNLAGNTRVLRRELSLHMLTRYGMLKWIFEPPRYGAKFQSAGNERLRPDDKDET